jgi:ABC-type amino acid transport substrate-binding protein
MAKMVRGVQAVAAALLVGSLGIAGSAALAQVAPPAPGESPLADAIRAAGVFRGGIVVSPPALLEDPATGELVGPSIVVAKAIAAGLHVEFRPVASTWDVVIAGLQSDSYDIAVAPLFATAKRLEVVDMATYYREGLCYMVSETDTNMAGTTTIDQLNSSDLTFRIVAGTAGGAHIFERFPLAVKSEIQASPGGMAGPESVASGLADIAYIDSGSARLAETRYEGMRIIPPVEECMANPDASVDVGVAMRKGDPVMQAFINQVIQAARPDIDAAMKKYCSPEYLVR